MISYFVVVAGGSVGLFLSLVMLFWGNSFDGLLAAGMITFAVVMFTVLMTVDYWAPTGEEKIK